MLAKELAILTQYQFWTLSSPEYDFTDAKECPEQYQALTDLIGSDPQENDSALDEFLDSSAGITELTIHSPATDSRPFTKEFCHDSTGEPMTYQEILDMIKSLYSQDDQDDWVDKIEVDPNHSSRLLISLTR